MKTRPPVHRVATYPHVQRMADHLKTCGHCRPIARRIFELQDRSRQRGAQPSKDDRAALRILTSTLCPTGLTLHTEALAFMIRSAQT